MDYAATYQKAAERDSSVRDAAFLEFTTSICGIEIRQMRGVDYLILDGLRSPILYGRPPSPEQLAAFLWILSPNWKPGAWSAFWFFRKVRKLNFGKASERVSEYMIDTLQDAPGGVNLVGETFNSLGASWVHRLGKTYGWPWRETMHTPLKILFQQIKCMRIDDGKQDTRSRRLLKLSGDRLRMKHARLGLLNTLVARATN